MAMFVLCWLQVRRYTLCVQLVGLEAWTLNVQSLASVLTASLLQALNASHSADKDAPAMHTRMHELEELLQKEQAGRLAAERATKQEQEACTQKVNATTQQLAEANAQVHEASQSAEAHQRSSERWHQQLTSLQALSACTEPCGWGHSEGSLTTCRSNREPDAESSRQANALEMLLHDVCFEPSPPGVQFALTCDMVGLPAQCPLRITSGQQPDTAPGFRHTASFDRNSDATLEALQQLAAGGMHLRWCNLTTATLGGFTCPLPKSHADAGQSVSIVAVAMQHSESGVPGVALYRLAEERNGQGSRVVARTITQRVAVLTVDWRQVLPDCTPAPQADEVVVALNHQDMLMVCCVDLRSV
jgi:hypothetical protein